LSIADKELREKKIAKGHKKKQKYTQGVSPA